MAAETIPGGEGQKRLLTQFVRIVRRHPSRPLRGSIELRDRFFIVGASIARPHRIRYDFAETQCGHGQCKITPVIARELATVAISIPFPRYPPQSMRIIDKV